MHGLGRLDNPELSRPSPRFGRTLDRHEDRRERGQPDCRPDARREPPAARGSRLRGQSLDRRRRARRRGSRPRRVDGDGGTGPGPVTGGRHARIRRPCGARGARCVGGGSSLDAIGFESESLLVVDATPGSAQVFLDGRPLGTAGELLARALPLAPGSHVVLIVAPAYRPWVARVAAAPPYSTRVRVALVPKGAGGGPERR